MHIAINVKEFKIYFYDIITIIIAREKHMSLTTERTHPLLFNEFLNSSPLKKSGVKEINYKMCKNKPFDRS